MVKNKVAPPFKEAYFDIIYGKGVVRENELITLGEENEFILKKGSWFSYLKPDGEEISLGQGKNNAVAFLKDDPKMRYELENRIREKHEIQLINYDEITQEKEEDEKGEDERGE